LVGITLALFVVNPEAKKLNFFVFGLFQNKGGGAKKIGGFGFQGGPFRAYKKKWGPKLGGKSWNCVFFSFFGGGGGGGKPPPP